MGVYIQLLVISQFASALCVNERPIIGILAQEKHDQKYQQFTSMIPASYVKAVEQAGARVVPVFINQTQEYYHELLSKINGIVFPGGSVDFNTSGGYADAGRIILKYAKRANLEGDHFPVLAICLGYELLIYLETESYDILEQCNATHITLPLQFEKQFHKSLLYKQIPKRFLEILKNKDITYNNHKWCVTKEKLKKYKVQEWQALTTSVDSDGLRFVSSAELLNSPIVGVQFHPEKSAYEWSKSQLIVHSAETILTNRWFYDWLVRQARKSRHSFQQPEEEEASLIYNYNVTFTHGTYDEQYFFVKQVEIILL